MTLQFTFGTYSINPKFAGRVEASTSDNLQGAMYTVEVIFDTKLH